MPSDAYAEYEKNLRDVRRLLAAHQKENQPNPGRRGLGHYTRGGLLLLCASWERYVETVVEEGAAYLSRRLAGWAQLPSEPKKAAQDHANSHKNSWTPAQLKGAQWGAVYLDLVKQLTAKLNTPKHHKLKPLFQKALGVPDIGAAWARGSSVIEDFVALRGDVAHRGHAGPYVRIGKLKAAKIDVTEYVVQTDNFLSNYLRTCVTPWKRPWKRIM